MPKAYVEEEAATKGSYHPYVFKKSWGCSKFDCGSPGFVYLGIQIHKGTNSCAASNLQDFLLEIKL